MPPALIPLLLLAVGIPAALRSLSGHPRAIGPAWSLALGAVLAAQAIGELSGFRTGVLGEAHILLGAIGAGLASLVVVVRERF